MVAAGGEPHAILVVLVDASLKVGGIWQEHCQPDASPVHSVSLALRSPQGEGWFD
jgi:hypothetical protein